MDYDWVEKAHRLNIHFKIPVFHGGVREKYGRNIPEPLETLCNSDDQLVPVETYSTVTDFARFRGWSTLQPSITAMW